MEKVKYLFVEKPVALTNKQAKAMIAKAKETGCNVQVGQVIRFWDEYVELKKIIESGVYGKVVNANFKRLSPVPTWGWNDWLGDVSLSGGAAQDLHIHDIDYVLSVFGAPKKFHSIKNTLAKENSYICNIMQYDNFPVVVEGTWGLPVSYPFQATFRVVFEKAVIENAGGKFMRYDSNGAEQIKIEKKELAGGYTGGNISDLGGYYNELLYFTDKAKAGEKINKATLLEASKSLEFLLKEIKNA
jgi:predicted dehydrogenase